MNKNILFVTLPFSCASKFVSCRKEFSGQGRHMENKPLVDATDVENAEDNKIPFTNLRERSDLADLNINSWSKGMLPFKRQNASIISVNNLIYLAGGCAYESQSNTNQIWIVNFLGKLILLCTSYCFYCPGHAVRSPTPAEKKNRVKLVQILISHP